MCLSYINQTHTSALGRSNNVHKLSKFVAAASEREDSHSANVFSAVVRFPTNSAKTVHTRTDHMSSVTQVIYEVDIESKNDAHWHAHTHTHTKHKHTT